jgi:hypothetical protein
LNVLLISLLISLSSLSHSLCGLSLCDLCLSLYLRLLLTVVDTYGFSTANFHPLSPFPRLVSLAARPLLISLSIQS